MINKIMLYHKAFLDNCCMVALECSSRMMSPYHWYIVRIFVSSPSISKRELKWNHITSPDVSSKAERAPVNGQGLGLTM